MNDTSVLLYVMDGTKETGIGKAKVCFNGRLKNRFLYFVDLSAVDFNFT